MSDILAAATECPTRLPEVIAPARARADDPRRLLHVVWGAALYVFVADTEVTG